MYINHDKSVHRVGPKELQSGGSQALLKRVRYGVLAAILATTGIGQADAALRTVSYIPAVGQDTGFCLFGIACRTLEYAVSVANPGDIIHVKSAPVLRGVENEILIDKDLSIFGIDVTAVKGTGERVKISGDNVNRIFRIDPDATVRLSNLDLIEGMASGTSPNGGAVLNAGSLIMLNCRVANSEAEGNGGGIYSTGGLDIISNEITLNEAEEGGGIYNTGTLEIRRDTFVTRNWAERGGALLTAQNDSSVDIDESHFLDNGIDRFGNPATNLGGAIMVGAQIGDQPTVSIHQSTLARNAATLNGGEGGAIVNHGALSLSYTLLDSNTSGGDGGALSVATGGEYDIDVSTFLGNSAGLRGGALVDRSILATPVPKSINRSSFIGNTAENVGGAIQYGSVASELPIDNSTFSGNTSGLSGGAIHNSSTNGSVRIASSTFVGNRGDLVVNNLPQGATFDSTGTFNMKNSIVDASADSSGSVAWACVAGQAYGGEQNFIGDKGNVDTSCGVAPFTAGTVLFIDPNATDNAGICVGASADCGIVGSRGTLPTHALLSGSNAIDYGSDNCPDAAGVTLGIDQNATPRPIGPICDMGSFEAP